MTMLGDFLRKLKATAKYNQEREGWLRAGIPFARKLKCHKEHHNDGATVTFARERLKSGSMDTWQRVRLGPNHVHALIQHKDGGITDLGISKNLLTNIGRDVMSNWMGGGTVVQNNPATATGATSFTGTGSTWTASNLATPQLGLAGWRAYFPITNITTAPVYGNIVSNTTSVATVDQWWTAADGVGTTPANTNAFIIRSEERRVGKEC